MIEGPNFDPEPGWGGRLSTWLSRNESWLATLILAIIFLALVFLKR